MRKVQVGLIGYGLSGSTFHAPIIRAVEGLQLSAVVSSSKEKVHQDFPDVCVTASSEELFAFDDIELVVIATPNDLHYPLALKAIQAGKHVVIDKPFVIESQHGKELIRLAESKGLLLSVYQNRRWDSDFLTVQRLISSGSLGKVMSYEAHFDRFRPVTRNRWKEQPLPGSGVLYDLGSHLIDQALYLFGLPKTVNADLGIQRTNGQSIDYFHLLLGYESLRVILHSGSYVRLQGPRYEIHGSEGSFIKYGIDPQEEALKAGKYPGEPGWGMEKENNYGLLSQANEGDKVTSQAVISEPGSYVTFYQGMYDSIVQGKPLPVTAEQALDNIRVIEAAMLSNDERRTIQLR
jgi:scyllo-inositol 2-dehydrogenase (NADP+)